MSSDPTSQANFLQVVSEHIDFTWQIDYKAQIVSGTAIHTVLVKEDGVKEVM